jgi:ADP-ribose pyrophosphatase YjhB (NUDIX family)
VVDATGNLLVIHRLGVWDLPKGKMEEGENPRETALREVEEECGITGLEVVEELPATYHTYPHKGQEVLKQTHWFLMRYSGTQAPTPQTEEDISAVKFMPAGEVAEALKNTYESLKPLFDIYLRNYKH